MSNGVRQSLGWVLIGALLWVFSVNIAEGSALEWLVVPLGVAGIVLVFTNIARVAWTLIRS